MDRSAYMKDWWANNPERRKRYEKKRYDSLTPEQKAARSAYFKTWRAKNKDEVSRKDREKYQRRKDVIAKQARGSKLNNPQFELWKAAKARAKRDEVPFDILPSDLTIPEYCPIFGVRLEIAEKAPTVASVTLDRVVPEKGYVKGNIGVISHRANCIKRDATASELRAIADYIDRMTGFT